MSNFKGFRTYDLAVKLYKQCKAVPSLQPHLRDHLLRASSSIVLNLAEGSAKPTHKDKLKFYNIALGSLRELQALSDLDDRVETLSSEMSALGAHLYRLIHH